MDCDIINEANAYASDMAGEFLTELGIFDMREMTPEQWAEFINVITKNYENKKVEIISCVL